MDARMSVARHAPRAQYSAPAPHTRWLSDPLARWRSLWRWAGVLALLFNCVCYSADAWAHWRCVIIIIIIIVVIMMIIITIVIIVVDFIFIVAIGTIICINDVIPEIA